MNYIIENWYIIVGILALIISLGLVVYKFLGLPTKEQIKKIKEVLLYWVIEAESEFGSKTGLVKLRYVYDLFVARFPMVAKLVSFETFSSWVDEALDKMKELLHINEAINDLVTK